MTQSLTVLSSAPAAELTQLDPGQELAEAVLPVVLIFGCLLIACLEWAQKIDKDAQTAHVRRERLDAYKKRHSWKRGDLQPLLSIGVNETAQRRMARLEGRGRPVVQWHRPWGEVVTHNLKAGLALLSKNASPEQRRHAFRTWPWWKHNVEAIYRGELELARTRQIRSPYDHAERTVADALRISQSKVHALCCEIRAMRREDPESANFEPMLVADYERWMICGEHPHCL